MIVCPNCNHPNPEGAIQCEACYTQLPALMSCPSCGASVQADASFCGQCGFNLRVNDASEAMMPANPLPPENSSSTQVPPPMPPSTVPDLAFPLAEDLGSGDPLRTATPPELMSLDPPLPATRVASSSTAEPASSPAEPTTQLQRQRAKLLHLQNQTMIELPQNLAVIHVGKPNDRVPPDIDVSGFPNSEIVSRIHADIRIEGEAYFIEDMGSSNGTYINNTPLTVGDRHRLRHGDRIALGKGDKVTFLFQVS